MVSVSLATVQGVALKRKQKRCVEPTSKLILGLWQGTACSPFELQPSAERHLGHGSTGSSGGAWSACTHLTRYGLNLAPFFLRFLATQLQPRSALEFGCGLGTTADYLARFTPGGANVTCVEPNEMHTEVYLRRRLPQRPTQLALNVLGTSGDERVGACKAALSSARFDLVYSLEVAEHIPDQLHAALVAMLTQATGRLLVFSASNVMDGVGHLRSSLRTKAAWIGLFERAGLKHMPGLSKLASEMAYPERVDIAKNVFVMRSPAAIDVNDSSVPTDPTLHRRNVFPWQSPLNFTGPTTHRHYLSDVAKVRDAQHVYEAALFPELHALAMRQVRDGCDKGSKSRPQSATRSR